MKDRTIGDLPKDYDPTKFYEQVPIDSKFPLRTFITTGNHITYPHWHQEIEFIYVLDGEVNFGIDNEMRQMKKGEIYIVRRGIVHYFYASPQSKRLILQFNLKIFESLPVYSDSHYNPSELFPRIDGNSENWSPELLQVIQEKMLQIYEASKNFSDLSNLYIFRQLLAIIQILEEKAPIKNHDYQLLTGSHNIQMLDSVLLYIEDHYREEINLEIISKYVGLQKNYFSRFFKKYMGIPFMQFLSDYRIIKARFLLETSRFPIDEVAELSGFTSTKTFYHQFKQRVGTSPKKYRKDNFRE